MTNHGGARKGAGRPPRPTPKAYPIWCGQMDESDRALILETLSPAERFDALMTAVQAKGEGMMKQKGQTVIWEWDDENRGTFYNQTITDIEEIEGHYEGKWNGRHVAAFSLVTGEWYPI